MIKRLVFGTVSIITVICLSMISFSYESASIAGHSESVFNNSGQVIIIDAGHGGFDGGAIASDGTIEKDLNLEIALKLQALCQGFGLNTVMVRTEDVAVNDKNESGTSAKVSDIKNRVSLMKKYPDAVFVSIHMNKYSTTQPHGAQVFFADVSGSEVLAGNIQKSIAGLVQQDNHRVIKLTTKDIYLLKHATIPSVIVECGFLSNPSDLICLKDERYQLKLATAIMLGILKNNEV